MSSNLIDGSKVNGLVVAGCDDECGAYSGNGVALAVGSVEYGEVTVEDSRRRLTDENEPSEGLCVVGPTRGEDENGCDEGTVVILGGTESL